MISLIIIKHEHKSNKLFETVVNSCKRHKRLISNLTLGKKGKSDRPMRIVQISLNFIITN